MVANQEYRTIVSTTDLVEHIEDPAWVILDTRFDLSNPGWGFADYQSGHIPGAVYAHLDRDLSAPIRPDTGRHPLPKMDTWVRTLSSWGVDDGKQVVVYDTTGGSFAARLWWMLRWVGHQKAAVLDGCYTKWVADGYPVQVVIETNSPSTFVPHPHPELLASVKDVEQIHLDPSYCLVDARAAPRYEGKEEPIDPVAGHIPGAVNRFHGDNLSPTGTFLSPDILRDQFLRVLGNIPSDRTIVYCGSGVTSCHHILAMEYAGLPRARLYAGSWSEWIRDPARPRISLED